MFWKPSPAAPDEHEIEFLSPESYIEFKTEVNRMDAIQQLFESLFMGVWSRFEIQRVLAKPSLKGKDQEGKPSKEDKREKSTCICGKKMWYSECSYLSPTVAQFRWKPDPEIQKKGLDGLPDRTLLLWKNRFDARRQAIQQISDPSTQTPDLTLISDSAPCSPSSESSVNDNRPLSVNPRKGMTCSDAVMRLKAEDMLEIIGGNEPFHLFRTKLH